MPGRNIVKQYGASQFYHLYSRGVAKAPVFLASADYDAFLSILKRYLSAKPSFNNARMPYPWFGDRIDLLAYCLMPNHFHLLIYQRDDELALATLMRSVMTSYSMYFNKRYGRMGPVFQSRYRASIIDRDNYLQHISRYIHLNPADWEHYKYSSIPYYSGAHAAEWIKPAAVLELFNSDYREYHKFLEDYEAHRQMLEELKYELAHE